MRFERGQERKRERKRGENEKGVRTKKGSGYFYLRYLEPFLASSPGTTASPCSAKPLVHVIRLGNGAGTFGRENGAAKIVPALNEKGPRFCAGLWFRNVILV
jgi:hypothetical protein